MLAAVCMDVSHMFVRRRRRRDARGQAFRILAAVCMEVFHMFVRSRRRRDACGQGALSERLSQSKPFTCCGACFVADVGETLAVRVVFTLYNVWSQQTSKRRLRLNNDGSLAKFGHIRRRRDARG